MNTYTTYTRKSRAKLLEAHRCLICKNDIGESTSITMCQDCANKASCIQSKRIKDRLAAGLCGACGNPMGPDSTKTQCRSCVDRFAYSVCKCAAKRRNYEFSLTRSQYDALHELPCLYCGQKPCRGVDRLNNRIGYTEINSVPCCLNCNIAKNDLSLNEFKEWIVKLYSRLSLFGDR